MAPIDLTRDEGLDLLSVLEEAAVHGAAWHLLTLVLAIEDAARLLIDRLYPDLPPAA